MLAGQSGEVEVPDAETESQAELLGPYGLSLLTCPLVLGDRPVLADLARVLGASHPDSSQLLKWQRVNRDLEPQQI